ncbi:hypothetical protein XENTR_v10018248 [Xenopus tropicalis]|uniref:CENP-T/Histone H4 histone fold domain-containing protein n=1 Tax=Xenopus tropicalis TaxID=8364 RepID=A0A6I8QJZ9_XENTR|nr:hypothetical protein XENTR_v10018248 [Xenopus tropicalis]
MADSPQDNMTTRSLLKQIIATEPTRSAVRYQLRKRSSQQQQQQGAPSPRTPRRRNANVSSPLHSVLSNMKERVRRSIRTQSNGNPTRESLPHTDATGPRLTRKGAQGLQGYVEDLDGITPRSLLRKIIQNEPEVSLIVSQKYGPAATSTEPEMTLGHSLSGVGALGVSLQELPEDEGKHAFGKAKKKKKRMSVTQFEEGVNQRLTQPEEHSASDVIQQSAIQSMSLHDLQEHDRAHAFGNAKKKKRMSITQFVQGVEQRLTQTETSAMSRITQPTEVQPVLADQSGITTFLQSSSLDTSAEPEIVQKHGLVRRPKKFNFVSLEDFEQGVHENYNLLKGSQECFVESATEDTGIQNETAHMNTELYAQPGVSERNLLRTDASPKETEEANLSNQQQTEEVYDKPMETEIEESYLEPLTQKQTLLKSQLEGEFEDYPLNAVDSEEEINESMQDKGKSDDEEAQPILGDRQLHDSENNISQTNEENDNRESHSPDTPEESVILNSTEVTLDPHVEYKSLATPVSKWAEVQHKPPEASRKESLSPANKSWHSPHQKATNQVSSLLPSVLSSITEKELDQPEDSQLSEQSEQLMAKSTDTALQEGTVTDEEESRSDDLSIALNQKVALVKQMLHPLTDTPAYVKNGKSKITKKHPAGNLAPRKKTNETRKKEPGLSSSFIKQLVNHSTQMKVSKDSYKEVETCLKVYFEQLCGDLTAYAMHANRKTITCSDIELLMRRQGYVTDAMPLNVLIERHLPMEYRRYLIPCASSGNQVYPKTKS